MTRSTSQYETFKAHREVLIGLIDRAGAAFRGLGMGTWAEAAGQLGQRLGTDCFRVMVLGEFKRGKSTFVNALLAAQVLPDSVEPCTAVISEVKWGDPARAVLHFRHPPPDPLPQVPGEARRHLEKHRGEPAPSLDIAVSELAEFVRIPDPTADQAASVADTPYDRVEVYWPLPLCRNGVEIIDSPGLNEHHTRTKTTRDYLAHVDAIIFVMSVHALASESELAVIDHDLRPAGHDYLFFVCNRVDELRKREDRERITSYAYAKLADRTRFGREGVFFLSGVDALEGRLDGDQAKVNRSGIVPLEQALERFLVSDRGRVKLLQPAAQLARGLRAALSEVIPVRRKLLDEDAGEIRKRTEAARPLLDDANGKRDTVLRQVDAARRRVHDAVRREAERFFADLPARVPAWTRAMATQTRMSGWMPFGQKKKADALTQEVVESLGPLIEQSVREWERTTLRPLVERQLAECLEDIKLSLDPFMAFVELVKAGLAGDLKNLKADVPASLGTVDKVLGGAMAGGAVAGGALILMATTNVAAVVSAFGVTATAGALASQVGAFMLPLLLNPVVLATVIVGGVLLAKKRGESLTGQVRESVAKQVAEQLRSEAHSKSVALADEVYTQTEQLSAAVRGALDGELRQVRERVDEMNRVKEAGEGDLTRQRQDLADHEAALRTVADDLNELILAFGQRG